MIGEKEGEGSERLKGGGGRASQILPPHFDFEEGGTRRRRETKSEVVSSNYNSLPSPPLPFSSPLSIHRELHSLPLYLK